jgi:farnesyl-diphosphate farnesyltransferase
VSPPTEGLTGARKSPRFSFGNASCPSGSGWEKNARAILKSTARSFYLSLQFLPDRVSAPLGLAYLLARATDTIADSSNSPLSERARALESLKNLILSINDTTPEGSGESQPTGEVARLAASMLQLIAAANPAELRLLRETPALLEVFSTLPTSLRPHIADVLRTIIDAQHQDIVRFSSASPAAPQALQSTQDLTDYTYAVAGCVGEFWTRVCEAQIPDYAKVPAELLMEHGRLFGQGLQLVNILRDLPEDLRSGRCYLPLDDLVAHGLTPAQLLSEPRKGRRLINPWIEQARAWLAHGAQYVQGIRGRRLRFSVSLPRLIGERTLDLLEKSSPLESVRRLRVPRRTVYACALRALAESIEP